MLFARNWIRFRVPGKRPAESKELILARAPLIDKLRPKQLNAQQRAISGEISMLFWNILKKESRILKHGHPL
jgi:hypothetical protein